MKVSAMDSQTNFNYLIIIFCEVMHLIHGVVHELMRVLFYVNKFFIQLFMSDYLPLRHTRYSSVF